VSASSHSSLILPSPQRLIVRQVKRDLASGGWNALQLALMSAGDGRARRNVVSLCELVVDRDP
jgi:hypothetical protein